MTDLTYRTRRDWTLAEGIIGIVSCATAITGISGGIVADALRQTASNGAWFSLFYGTGSFMLVIAVMDRMCRGRCDSVMLCRFAITRMWLHFANALCWLSAFLWLSFTHTFVASILYESVPLMLFNLWGASEHAKAVWLKPREAQTTSLADALYRRYLHRG